MTRMRRQKISVPTPRPKPRAPHRPTRVHDQGRTRPSRGPTIEEELQQLYHAPADDVEARRLRKIL